MNANGQYDAGEPKLSGWAISVVGTDGMGNPVNITQMTDEFGNYEFKLVPGTYTVSETLKPGWIQSFPAEGVYDITLVSGEVDSGNNFGNYRLARKTGFKFEDMNANGQYDSGEPMLSGWAISVVGTDGMGNPVNETILTDSSGYYGFMLVPGTYTISEEDRPGWIQSYPASGAYVDEVFVSGGRYSGNNFGNYQLARKSGFKFEDMNANGVYDSGEPRLSGWAISVVGTDGMGVPVNITVTTGPSGYYEFKLVPGTYTISEENRTGWIQSYPASGAYVDEVFVSGGNYTGNDFGNYRLATKSGHKFYDANYDGIWNCGEPGLEGWIITVVGTDGAGNAVSMSTVTDVNGKYEFKLVPGKYTISEVMPLDENWEQTAPASGSFTETFVSGQESLCNNFGNIYWNDETAWGYGLGGYAIEFMAPPMNMDNWGWTNGPISQPVEFEPEAVVAFELWADTGGNYFPDGTQVGVGTIRYTSGGSVTVTYEFYDWVKLNDIHVWIGDDYLPMKNGRYTNAPGQFNYKSYTSLGGNVYEVYGEGFSGEIYVAAHAVVEYAAKIPPPAVYP
jgi:hypothetical protein